jgi:hypothetical protein
MGQLIITGPPPQVELNQVLALQDSKSGLSAPPATKPKDNGKDKDEEKDSRRRRATLQKQQDADAELIKLLQSMLPGN